MPRDQQRLADYLGHIAEAIERIVRYTGGMDEVAVLNNQLVQDAVIRNFEIIGEASNNIEKHHPDFAALHPECLCRSLTRCATLLRMATSRWTLKSFGRRSTVTFRPCTNRFRTRRPAPPIEASKG
ncbi:UNVERIFIED_CONTAM: uncharacterized protein DUF86 [Acidovorax defluvii]